MPKKLWVVPSVLPVNVPASNLMVGAARLGAPEAELRNRLKARNAFTSIVAPSFKSGIARGKAFIASHGSGM